MRRGRAATALFVRPGGDGFASAFCIDPSGYFVTVAHAVDGLRPGEGVALVLGGGGDDARTVSAAVVRTDREQDLALLKADATLGDVPAVELGDAETLSPADDASATEVTYFGYPFGGDGATAADYARPVVTVGRVRQLRRTLEKTLSGVSVDAPVNPGHSGGPALVRSYHVADDYDLDWQVRRGQAWRVYATTTSSSRGVVLLLLFHQDSPNPTFPSPPVCNSEGLARSKWVRHEPVPPYERFDSWWVFCDYEYSPLLPSTSFIGGPVVRFSYAIPVALCSVLPLAWTWRRWRARRQPAVLCPACGYSLTGNVSGICPECGAAMKGVAA